jgi:DNA polymerase-3 subunit gamma/tau
MAALLQRIAVYQVVGATDAEDEDDERELAALAGEISAEDVQLFYQIALIGRRDLYLAPDPKSGAEMTLLRMLAFQPGGDVSPSIRGDTNRNAAARSQPAETKSSKAATGVAVSETTAWQDPDWSKLIDQIEISGAGKLLASNCAFVRRQENVLHLCLDGKSETLLTQSTEAALRKALCAFFGESLRLDISIGETASATPIQEEARRVDAKYAAARASIEADPNVKALKDMFGAELNADSIEPIQNLPSANQE